MVVPWLSEFEILRTVLLAIKIPHVFPSRTLIISAISVPRSSRIGNGHESIHFFISATRRSERLEMKVETSFDMVDASISHFSLRLADGTGSSLGQLRKKCFSFRLLGCNCASGLTEFCSGRVVFCSLRRFPERRKFAGRQYKQRLFCPNSSNFCNTAVSRSDETRAHILRETAAIREVETQPSTSTFGWSTGTNHRQRSILGRRIYCDGGRG